MSSPRVLLASIAFACLVVVGTLVYPGDGVATSQGIVAWAETAGAGTVFPACGSATAGATCVNGAGQALLSWDFSSNHSNAGLTSITFTDPNRTRLVNETRNGLSGSIDIPGLGVGTYTYDVTPTYDTGGSSYQDPPSQGSVYVPNCSSPPQGTPALSINKQLLPYQAGQACSTSGNIVHPGDSLCYRMNIFASGADQSGVQVRDRIPGGTTMVWQGGGTDTNSSAQIVGGVDGNGDAWWYQYTTPATGWGSYVDFTARVNDNYFSQFGSGSSICNDARILSNQVGVTYSNGVCSPVGPNNPAWISGACDASGTATISWASSDGAVSYYPRLWIPSGTCPNPENGWRTWTDGHTCYIDGFRGGTAITVTGLAPGGYSTWVYAGEPLDWNLPPTVTTFSCPAAATASIQGYKVPTEDTVVARQTVSVSGGPTSAENPYGFSVAAGATYTVSVPPLSGYMIGYTLCIDRTDCHNNTPTPGASASATIPSGDGHYVDLWWHYTQSGPDLTPINLVPNQVTVNVASTFTATVENGGTVATPSFGSTVYVCPRGDTTCMNTALAKTWWGRLMAFFQPVAYAASAIRITLADTILAAGAQGTQNGIHTFTTEGEYMMRLCADLPNNEVSEINENNNCGEWTLLVVGPSPSLTCSRSPSSSSLSAPATVTYAAVPSGDARSPYVFRDALGTVLQSGGRTSYQATYNDAGTYAVTVSASNVSSPVACGPPVTVTDDLSCSALSNSITANPTRLPGPGETTVSWEAFGVDTSCEITKNGVNWQTAGTPSGPPACSVPDGEKDDSISIQTTYCITCDGNTAARDCVTVNVGGQFQEF